MGMMYLILPLWYTVTRTQERGSEGKEWTMRDQTGYQIQIEGRIGERWAHWFEGATVRFEQAHDGTPVTTLNGAFDQAALRGLLAKIWDLNLTVLSVNRVEPRGAKSDG